MSKSPHELALIRIYALLANDLNHDSSQRARAEVAEKIAGDALGEERFAPDDGEDPEIASACGADEAEADRISRNYALERTPEDRLLETLKQALADYDMGLA